MRGMAGAPKCVAARKRPAGRKREVPIRLSRDGALGLQSILFSSTEADGRAFGTNVAWSLLTAIESAALAYHVLVFEYGRSDCSFP
jgi:hypothetical protein